jgi:hypothetical protein
MGTFTPAEYRQGKEAQEYEKKPRFGRVDTLRLWEEYQAQRSLRRTLREVELAAVAVSTAQQIEAVKACARQTSGDQNDFEGRWSAHRLHCVTKQAAAGTPLGEQSNPRGAAGADR